VDTENWLKNLNKRVVLGSVVFATVGLIALYAFLGFTTRGFLWFLVGGLTVGVLSHLLSPVVLRQRTLVTLGFVFFLALLLSFMAGVLLSQIQSQNFVNGSVFGWIMGSFGTFRPGVRGSTSSSEGITRRNLVFIGYAMLFAITMIFGVALSDLLF
jgi:hypothetical protein